MKKLLKGKAIIYLFIIMLGFTYIKSTPTNTLNNGKTIEKEEIVYKNN